jgi:hypothetical protein
MILSGAEVLQFKSDEVRVGEGVLALEHDEVVVDMWHAGLALDCLDVERTSLK